MVIYGKTNIHHATFEDLKTGDVFYFLKDCKDITKRKIYMRCGHTQSDFSAVNLETGTCYKIEKNEPVEILDATITIEQKQK